MSKSYVSDTEQSILVEIRDNIAGLTEVVHDLVHAVRNLPEGFAAAGPGEETKFDKHPRLDVMAMARKAIIAGLDVNFINGDAADWRIENIEFIKPKANRKAKT